MLRGPQRSTRKESSAASDVYNGQVSSSARESSPTVQGDAEEAQEEPRDGTCNATGGGLNMGILGILGWPALIGARKLKRNR